MANPGCSDGSMQVQRASNNIIESVKFGIHITAGKDGQELVWLVSKISSKCARLIVLITTCCYVVGRRLRCFHLKLYKNWQVITDGVVDHAATTYRQRWKTKITSSRDFVVAVILVGCLMSCWRFISDEKLFNALLSAQAFLRSQFKSPSITMGLLSVSACM